MGMTQSSKIVGKLHGNGGKIISGRLAWLPFSHQSAVPGGSPGRSRTVIVGCSLILGSLRGGLLRKDNVERDISF